MTDLAIVSMHEKGFPQGDLYLGHGDTPADEFACLGLSPDAWFSLRKGDTLDAAKIRAAEAWPGAKIVEAESDDDTDEDE